MQIIDGIGQKIEFKTTPKRIVSLVPSLTELLFDLGLENEIVGVTKFCTRPAHARKVAKKVGGTKKFDFEIIDLLQPDLIIANKEENYKEGIEQLIGQHPVYVSDIFNLDDAVDTIKAIGLITGKSDRSAKLSQQIITGFKNVKASMHGSVLYFIWQSPDMVVGTQNFIDFTLNWLGFQNLAEDKPRYPEMTISELSTLTPDYVMLSSEPYPFKDKHAERYQELFPDARILLVDGEMFSWYGSRLLHAPEYFSQLSLEQK